MWFSGILGVQTIAQFLFRICGLFKEWELTLMEDYNVGGLNNWRYLGPKVLVHSWYSVPEIELSIALEPPLYVIPMSLSCSIALSI